MAEHRVSASLILGAVATLSLPIATQADEPTSANYQDLSRYYLERQPAGLEVLTYNVLTSVASAEQADGNMAIAAGRGLRETIKYYFDPALGMGLPDWAKRIEFEWELRENVEPEFTLLTVQPIYQADDKADTIFTQLSLVRQQQLGDPRFVVNLGLGYRRLLMDNRLLLGANAFYDYELDFSHKRLGVGAEAKVDTFDLSYNHYIGLGGKADIGGGNFEEVLDGWDVELRSQLPYLPWARIGVKRYLWDTKVNAEDITGHAASVEMDIVRNVGVEVSVQDDNTDDKLVHVAVRLRPASAEAMPTEFSSAFVSTRFFEHRDLTSETLAKVRRENRIVVERTGSGVVISRGN